MPNSKSTDTPDEAAPAVSPASDVKYTLVIPSIPIGPATPGQFAWVESEQAEEYIKAGFATKVLRKDAPDVGPPPG